VTTPAIALGGQIRFRPTRRQRYEMKVKRAFDVVVAAVLLVLLSPLFLAVAIAVRLDSPGPVLFLQNRVGQGGRLFNLLKFRSMYADADEAVHREVMRQFAKGEPVRVIDGRPVFKPLDDPRVTRVGRLIRTTNIDELPQLINVLKGEMSLVGPRPVIPYELELFGEAHYRRLAVPQGITGLWQVKREQTRSLADVLNLDLEYVDRFSLLLDLQIILRTFPKLLPRPWSF